MIEVLDTLGDEVLLEMVIYGELNEYCNALSLDLQMEREIKNLA